MARQVFAKYRQRHQNRVQPLLHIVTKRIVDEAKTRRYGIVLERLTGIRRLYRKGNGQSKNYRARMNSWSYGELQRQIEYKARWEGLKVIYVPAWNTSKQCSICGYKTLESTHRRPWCPKCGTILDRDENRGQEPGCGRAEVQPQRASRRSKGRGTGTGERDPNPQSRWRQVKSANAGQNRQRLNRT